MHPARTVRRAVTPRPIKRARRALNPLSNAKYSLERSIPTGRGKSRRSPAPVYTHGNCPVQHRTPQAAAKCRNR